MNAALKVIGKLAASVRDIEMPASNDTTILRAEAYAYHAENVKKNPELYQPETLKRIRAGEDVTTATYIQARRQVDQYRHNIRKVFETVDLLITPTTPVPPFTISELLADMDNLRTKEILTLRNTGLSTFLDFRPFPCHADSPNRAADRPSDQRSAVGRSECS